MSGFLRHPDLRVLVLVLIAPAVHAATFRGTVTHVSDGDTVWVRPESGGAAVKVRLVGIDAPETCQAYGPQARDALAGRVLHQQVVVRTRARDEYHRQLARIEREGEDVNAWMVRHGQAWAMTYKGRRGAYARFELQARRARAGLWAQPDAENPRSFRQRFGPCP